MHWQCHPNIFVDRDCGLAECIGDFGTSADKPSDFDNGTRQIRVLHSHDWIVDYLEHS
jgi:hypothetical protein